MTEQKVEKVGRRVRGFYEHCSFPGYEDFEDIGDLVSKANRSRYARLLDEQVRYGTRILDAGCGTGQLPIFLSLTNRKVLGIDFSLSSLRKGMDFKRRFKVPDADFIQMDLFHLGLRRETFDYIFSNGVLHHTADARGAFRSLCELLRPEGYFILGLYNTYGRIFLDLRRWLFKLTAGQFKRLDYFMRQRWMGDEKKEIWYQDQYRHPHEKKYTVGDVLQWFAENRIEYVNSVPKIRLGERFAPTENLFEGHSPGTGVEQVLKQLGWVFTQGKEGGFFIIIGKKGGSVGENP